MIESRRPPASKAAITAHLGRLMNTCGTEQKLTAAEVEAKLNEYARHLAEFSEAHLDATISEYVRTEKWFPKISELRERLMTRRNRADVWRHRARVLLGLDQPTSWEIELVRRCDEQRTQREIAAAPPPDLTDKIAKLPPALAGSVQRMLDTARKTPEQKQEAAE